MQRKTKPWPTRAGITVTLILRGAHSLQALGQRQSVTVIAPRRRSVTASRRVPRGISPLYGAVIGHASILPHIRRERARSGLQSPHREEVRHSAYLLLGYRDPVGPSGLESSGRRGDIPSIRTARGILVSRGALERMLEVPERQEPE